LSQTSLDGYPLPPEARAPGRSFAVLHQPADERGLDRKIASSLNARGLDAVTGEPGSADYIVSYIDRWYWDMRMYLIDLRIDVREAETNILLATARSYQTSLDALGETHDSIIERTVNVLIEGSEPERRRREEAARRERSRHK
jgi:hypothetical protein